MAGKKTPFFSRRIFVVENHPDTLHYLVLYLQAAGHQTAQARTVAEAREKWAGADCDVLISDIGLPDGDGWELLRSLVHAGSAPRLAIAMSGFGRNADAAKSRAAGYAHHLIKPFDPGKLDEILDSFAGGEALRTEKAGTARLP